MTGVHGGRLCGGVWGGGAGVEQGRRRMRRAADAAAHNNVRYARGCGGGEGAGGEAATPSWLARMPRVAAAASWSCRDGSHGLMTAGGGAGMELGRHAIIHAASQRFAH